MIKVFLKDGTYLYCDVYETDDKGELPILNHERIIHLFEKRDELINFQTRVINGKFHPNNVVYYEIDHENEYT